MGKFAYYNEIDPFAAAWLRELIKAGHIADGEVDERSIEDVCSADLATFTQCHFFAGIGVWSLALRRAGWPDDRPVWTGSCPCQPFSAAGKGGGFADERHLWPAFHWLIEQCRPVTVFGEQVASKDGLAWLDLVQADLEGTGYASGAVDTCAAGFGAPHIRQRLYWVADAVPTGRSEGRPFARPGSLAGSSGLDRLAYPAQQQQHGAERGGPTRRPEYSDLSATCGLDHHQSGLEGFGSGHQTENGRQGQVRPVAKAGELSGLADTDSGRAQIEFGDARETQRLPQDQCQSEHDPYVSERGSTDNYGRNNMCGDGISSHASRAGPVNGHWGVADWLFCRDGKWRPVEPGAFPLAHGAPARVGRLRGYGNAINAAQAQGFIEAVRECLT